VKEDERMGGRSDHPSTKEMKRIGREEGTKERGGEGEPMGWGMNVAICKWPQSQ
jgi:hypothetical protein